MSDDQSADPANAGTTVDMATLQKQRRAALLGKWSKGAKLTREEMEEIRHFLPAAAADSSSEHGSAVSSEQAARRLTDRPRYKKRLADYCDEFEVGSDRTLKRWIATGKAAEPADYPPLDSPELMASWWTRRMAHKVPKQLRLLSEIGRGKEGGARGDEEKVSVAKPREELLLPEGVGFAAELDRIRQDTRIAAAEKDRAKRDGDVLEFENASARYETQLKLLREFERDAEKIMQASGDLVPRAALEKVAREMHGNLVQSLRSMVNIVDPELKKLTSVEQRRQAWNEALDRVFVQLDMQRWAAPWKLAE